MTQPNTPQGRQNDRSEGARERGAARGESDRSFAAEPGHTPPSEGGGAMSGRGAEEGGGWRAQARDAEERVERDRPEGGVGGGGVGGAGTGGAGLAHTASGQGSEGLAGEAAAGPESSAGPQGPSGVDAGRKREGR